MSPQPNADHGLHILDEVSRSHSTTHHFRYDSSGQVISPSQRFLTTDTTHNRQTTMPPVGFEPTISADERPQTYALDRAATGIGLKCHLVTANVQMLIEVRHTHTQRR